MDVAITKFQEITGYNLTLYLDEFATFVEDEYRNIINYYSGFNTNNAQDSFVLLANLKIKANEIESLIQINQQSFITTQDVELIEFLDNIKIKLDTFSNAGIYLNSNKINSGVAQSGTEIFRTLEQNETIQGVSSVFLNSADRDNDWYRIALENNLKEEDWEIEGGATIRLIIGTDDESFQMDSIIGGTLGENLYGRDISQDFKIEGNDLVIVQGVEAFEQSVNIRLTVLRGDVPEFENLGIDNSIMAGSNTANLLTYPVLVRKLTEIFATDDTIAEFSIGNIETIQDVRKLDIAVISKYRQVYSGIINLVV